MSFRNFYSRSSAVIEQAFESDKPVLVDVLPALGKSTGVIKWVANSGEQIVIFTERHDLYEQLKDNCREFGVSYQTLPSHLLDCPTASKSEADRKHGDEWKRRFDEKIEAGFSGRALHEHAHRIFGEELPCQTEGECPYLSQLNKQAEDFEEIDVLIGNYRHMFKPAYSNSRQVVIDESPGDSVLTELTADDVNDTINRYLSNCPVLPFLNTEDILRFRLSREENPQVRTWLDSPEGNSIKSAGWNYDAQNPGPHAYGAILVRAALDSTVLPEGWHQTELGDGTIVVKSPKGTVFIQPPFPFEHSNVVALDGTPSVAMWRVLLGDELEPLAVLTDEEKAEWVGHLGIRIIQTTRKSVPARAGSNNTQEAHAVVEEVYRREDSKPFVVTSKQGLKNLRRQYKDFEDLIQGSENFSNLKGRNDLDQISPVLIIGCPQLSDEHIQKWVALGGHKPYLARDTNGIRLPGEKSDFGPVGNDVLHGTRENELLQAAMRFSRKPGRESEIRVYVHSSAIPEWVQPEPCLLTVKKIEGSQGFRQVYNALTHGEDWQDAERSTKEIESIVEKLHKNPIGYHQIRKHLNTLNEDDTIGKERRGSCDYWWNISLERRGKDTIVLCEC
ncbi:hypothetical protein [Halobellus rarus]|uniref:Uncharacterized protein n=1 Tax=Halobellus rarus TaxID=1126237 RepID=A0ABD6CLT1_9EURY|nr:hypothetical protein [Halobellus rarus]